MKKLAFAALAAIGLALASCTTTPTTATGSPGAVVVAQSPAQIAAQICPVAQVIAADLQADVGLPAGALKDITTAAPKIAALCATASTINGADLQSLENLAFQTLLPIAQAADPKLAAEIEAVQIIVTVVQAQQAAQAGGTAAAAVSPAPTPAATGK